jgi:hypothetical protein
MRDIFTLFLHAIVTIIRLAQPGGFRAVVAESGRNAWTKRYFGQLRIWSRNSNFSRTISIGNVCIRAWMEGCQNLMKQSYR